MRPKRPGTRLPLFWYIEWACPQCAPWDLLLLAGNEESCRNNFHGIPFRCVDYSHIITIESGKRSGKPCIRGMRITVYDVLDYLASGMTEEEILADFSELTREDIKACLAFAADRERKLFPPAA